MSIAQRWLNFKARFSRPQQTICEECGQDHNEIERAERIALMQAQRSYIALKKAMLMFVFFVAIIYAVKTVYGNTGNK